MADEIIIHLTEAALRGTGAERIDMNRVFGVISMEEKRGAREFWFVRGSEVHELLMGAVPVVDIRTVRAQTCFDTGEADDVRLLVIKPQ